MAFEESYRISERAVREAYRRFQNRERSGKNSVPGTKKSVAKSLKIEQPETPEQKFKELMLRLDNLWLHLQLKIRKGRVGANAAGLRIMKFTAKLYGLGAGPPQEETKVRLVRHRRQPQQPRDPRPATTAGTTQTNGGNNQNRENRVRNGTERNGEALPDGAERSYTYEEFDSARRAIMQFLNVSMSQPRSTREIAAALGLGVQLTTVALSTLRAEKRAQEIAPECWTTYSGSQRIQYPGSADVAAMYNHIRSPKELEGLRSD